MRPSIKEAELRKVIKNFGRTPALGDELLRNMEALLAAPPIKENRPWQWAASISVIPGKHIPGSSGFGKASLVGQLTRAACCAIPPLMSHNLNRMVLRWALLTSLWSLLRRDYLGWFDNEQAYRKCMDEALDRLLCLPMRFRPRATHRRELAVRPVICVEREPEDTINHGQHLLILDCLPPFMTRADYEQVRSLRRAIKNHAPGSFRFTEYSWEGSDPESHPSPLAVL